VRIQKQAAKHENDLNMVFFLQENACPSEEHGGGRDRVFDKDGEGRAIFR
jgi:hypothetical protein